MSKCEYCNFDDSNSNEIYIDDFGLFEINHYGKNEYHEEEYSIECRYECGECEMYINYCPMCGRKLVKEK
jgi:hypothetical protein